MATQPSDSAKQRPRSSPGDELAVIAQRAQAFTNASGAAIALSEGSEDEIVCRARSGASAPDIGTPVRVQGSFIGLCIQTGKELRCDDAETDTRVDTVAIRALGIRSMVVTPIREDNRVTGVLAVFAPTPHAFTITHVAVLKTMADQIAALLQKERRTREESALHPEPPVIMPKPMAVVPAPAPAPAPVVIKPAASPSAAASAPARSSSAPVSKVEPIKPVPLAAEVAAPVPFPKKEEKRVEARPEPVMTKASFGTLDAVAGEQKEKPAGSKMIFIGIAALVLVAGGVFVMRWQKSSSSSSASGTSAAPQSAQTASNAAPSPAVPSAGATTQPSATSTTDSAAGANTSTFAAPSKPAIAERPDTRKTDQAKNSNVAQTTKPSPTPATVAIGSSPSRIAYNAGQPQTAPDVAPSLAVGSGSSSNALSSLAKPANNAAPAALVQSELVPLQVIRKVPPVYPEFARARRVSGPVVVRVRVGTDGKVNNVKFVSGALIFRDAAFDAAKQSQYKPALLNGKPIEQEMDIRMNFSPN
ncbi:MAG TPA: TonB family protein [Candidatus Solibacter sp.]|jgi:TonB family protein|nr:TonB family protein [Candidatus Solibacter sp.]